MNFQSIHNYTNTKILIYRKVVPTYFFMHHVSSNHSKTKEVPLQTNEITIMRNSIVEVRLLLLMN